MKKGIPMKLSFYLIPLLIITIFLPSCRYVHWAHEIFNQGCPVYSAVACGQQYVRSLRIYDQFTTLGIFDALWVSDHVRDYYEDLHTQLHCLEQQECSDDNDNPEEDLYTTFYVLSWIKGYAGSSLTDKDTLWSMCLSVNGVNYSVTSIKEVAELAPEYKSFFGKTFTRFKNVYLVKFAVPEAVINAAGCFELLFHYVGIKGSMVWRLDCQGAIIPERTFDKNILAYDL